MRNVFEYYKENDYLAHHGILGQKWGVRRYQNKDGSLTEAGQARYAARLNASNLHKTAIYDSKVDKKISADISKRIKARNDAFEGYFKTGKELVDYEDRFWKNKEEVRKCAEIAVDDSIKKYGDHGLSRSSLLYLYMNDDLGQHMFYDYYLPNNPKAQREYDALVKKHQDAYDARNQAIKDICEECLGKNGEKTSFQVVKKVQVRVNDVLTVEERNATLNDILKREINRQTLRF